MRWSFSPEQEGLREQVRAFLAEQSGLLHPRQYFLGRGGASRELYRRMGQRGWLSLAWPRQWGGAGASPSTEFIVWDELAYARAARPDLAAGIVAKTIIAHGSDEQKERFLPGIRCGDIGFALGYSEPEAGSDLASVRTRAVREPAGYRVTGEKRWTSDAHNSDYLWLLCRSDGEERGHTILIVALDSPGIEIRPIITIDGHRLNEVVLDNVFVPDENRVGGEGDGWRLIRSALAVERHLMVLPGRVRRDFEELLRWARDGSRLDDPWLRRELADIAIDVAEVEASALCTLAAMESGLGQTTGNVVAHGAPARDTAASNVVARDGLARDVAAGEAVVEAARAKLLASRAVQRIARLPFAAGDVTAAVGETDQAFLWHETFMETIAGGTSEIMLGILAREALGLGGRR